MTPLEEARSLVPPFDASELSAYARRSFEADVLRMARLHAPSTTVGMLLRAFLHSTTPASARIAIEAESRVAALKESHERAEAIAQREVDRLRGERAAMSAENTKLRADLKKVSSDTKRATDVAFRRGASHAVRRMSHELSSVLLGTQFTTEAATQAKRVSAKLKDMAREFAGDAAEQTLVDAARQANAKSPLAEMIEAVFGIRPAVVPGGRTFVDIPAAPSTTVLKTPRIDTRRARIFVEALRHGDHFDRETLAVELTHLADFVDETPAQAEAWQKEVERYRGLCEQQRIEIESLRKSDTHLRNEVATLHGRIMTLSVKPAPSADTFDRAAVKSLLPGDLAIMGVTDLVRNMARSIAMLRERMTKSDEPPKPVVNEATRFVVHVLGLGYYTGNTWSHTHRDAALFEQRKAAEKVANQFGGTVSTKAALATEPCIDVAGWRVRVLRGDGRHAYLTVQDAFVADTSCARIFGSERDAREAAEEASATAVVEKIYRE